MKLVRRELFYLSGIVAAAPLMSKIAWAQAQSGPKLIQILRKDLDGQGVALARTTLAAWDLVNGRLVKPFDLGLKLSRTYWIVCPKATSTKPKVTTFRDWLLAEAADDARRLRKMFASKL